MVELTEKAAQYAAEKANDVIANALAKAYEDGYRDGYKDREEEIPVDLRDNKTEYVDLGLPSGTLWSTDFETEDGKIIYLPFSEAKLLSIPTVEEWEELFNICKWHGDYSSSGSLYYLTCIGPNGNSISIRASGYIEDRLVRMDLKWKLGDSCFWLKGHETDNNQESIYIGSRLPVSSNNINIKITKMFTGYKLPIRLIKSK